MNDDYTIRRLNAQQLRQSFLTTARKMSKRKFTYTKRMEMLGQNKQKPTNPLATRALHA
jgi:hypothetical protein